LVLVAVADHLTQMVPMVAILYFQQLHLLAVVAERVTILVLLVTLVDQVVAQQVITEVLLLQVVLRHLQGKVIAVEMAVIKMVLVVVVVLVRLVKMLPLAHTLTTVRAVQV
jgi:hypothetical protein